MSLFTLLTSFRADIKEHLNRDSAVIQQKMTGSHMPRPKILRTIKEEYAQFDYLALPEEEKKENVLMRM